MQNGNFKSTTSPITDHKNASEWIFFFSIVKNSWTVSSKREQMNGTAAAQHTLFEREKQMN